MLPAAIATQTVTRLRGSAGTDTHSNITVDWTSPGSLSISGCSVQPMDGAENLIGRDSVVSRWQLFLPEDADVTSADRITHKGITYEVDGSVQEWDDPTGAGLDHKVCFLRLVEG